MKGSVQSRGANVGLRCFLTAIIVVALLMVGTYALTFIIPGGTYTRIPDAAGNTVIDPNGGFTYVPGGIPFWQWLLSPLLALGAEGGGMIAAILVFLLVIGGVFTALQDCGLMNYMLERLVAQFGRARYRLLAVIAFFFMAMGAFVGSFEECIPLVPIVAQLAVSLGWDTLTGLGMSLLAVGCGFAAGVCNPFTIGVAQSLAGLPMFSGIWLRLVSFGLIYALLLAFLLRHAKVCDAFSGDSLAGQSAFTPSPAMDKALLCFGSIMGTGLLAVLSSSLITVLQDYTMIIVAVMFLAAGLTAAPIAGLRGSRLAKSFFKGMASILPAVALILMASSIKYTLTQANILDTLLYWTVQAAAGQPRWAILLLIYLLVLGLNFFISSGSAKAFLLMPLLLPMAQVFDLSAQLCVLAFAFGDGFSNVFYPTNAALLIALGLAGISYGDWVRFSWKFQAVNLLLTGGLLLFGLAVGYC